MKQALIFHPTLKRFLMMDDYIERAQTFLKEKGFESKQYSFYEEVISKGKDNHDLHDFLELFNSLVSTSKKLNIADKFMEKNKIKDPFMFTIAKHLEEASKYDAIYFPREYEDEPFLFIMYGIFNITDMQVFIEE